MRHLGATGSGSETQGKGDAGQQYYSMARPFVGHPVMALSPFEVRDLHAWVEYPSDDEAVFEEAFRDFERMWADKWHGKDGEGPGGAAMAGADAHSSIVDVFLKTLSSLSTRLRGSSSDGTSPSLHACGSWDEEERRGLFNSQSWKRLFSSKPISPKYTKSGPCELFADWPIPPYPDDYVWDD